MAPLAEQLFGLAFALCVIAFASLIINVATGSLLRVSDKGLYWAINLSILPFVSSGYGLWTLLTYEHPKCPPVEGFVLTCTWASERVEAVFSAFPWIMIVPIASFVIAVPMTMFFESKCRRKT